MSFESVDDAREFYNAYAKRIGFTIRTYRIRHSQKTKAIIARDCKKDRILPPRPITRLGCKAIIRLDEKDGGQWVVTKFLQEHNHKLMTHNTAEKVTGSSDHLRTSGLSEGEKDKKIEELFNELQHEKQRSASFRERLYLVLNDIEVHTHHMSLRVQDTVNNVREIESSKV
ncbi:hypothetical protein MKX01_018725 [Papaver californicum]|nr:hypothetical protein MKX01_018725 [Papaver californicum]